MAGDVIEPREFILGVNYWPIRKAMYWWQSFDAAEVQEDFRRIGWYGFKVVRIFLLWEDFQPAPFRISPTALGHLVSVADTAQESGLLIMPTLFCGHMSGVNWLPGWMLGSRAEGTRFPVMSKGLLQRRRILDFYTDRELSRAQLLLCREVAGALKGHPAVWAYDLGNEASNCVVPPDRERARNWLEMMAGELRHAGGECRVTLGLHAEDLEEDRNLGPREAARACDFLCMHGYPFYLKWVENPLDFCLPSFLGEITRWLGGKPVLLEELGVHDGVAGEQAGADFYRQALELLRERGMLGAFAWCFGDYHPDLWNRPPLKDNPHERCFGLYRHDGSPKPAAEVFRDFGRKPGRTGRYIEAPTASWLEGEDSERFYRNPLGELKRLYLRYKETLGGKAL